MERLREVTPDRVLAVLDKNYGRPVSGDKISEVVWGEKYKVSNHYIHVLMKRCRSYLESNLDNEKASLYTLYQSTAYMLTDTLKIGSWVDIPHKRDCRMGLLSDVDINLIHQREVRPRQSLVGRISPAEYNFLGFLCYLTEMNDGEYVNTQQLAMACFGFTDSDERHCVTNTVSRLRKKITCLSSIEIQSDPLKGHKIVKRS